MFKGILIFLSFSLIFVAEGFAENYRIKKGDTLYSISKKYKVSIKEIKEANGLKNDSLRAGEFITIPKSVKGDGVTGKSQRKIEIDEAELENLNKKERIVLFAKKFLNIPYRFGGTTLRGIDCSAYVRKVYNFLNIPLPRTAREQFIVGDSVDKNDLTIGDLVFFRTYATFPSHVGIYIGNNLFIHASRKARKVRISSLNNPYFFKRFIGAKRIFEPESEEPEGIKDNLDQPS
ncbi:MAG TPA: hypothetical protein DEP99_06385 [Nitrospiraceae bacterium]|nr:hypothetical protein [Nitrospiraceae bacterium]